MFTWRPSQLRRLYFFVLFAGVAGLVEEELYQGPTDGLPYFMSEPMVIKTTENDTVVLPCIVENLGDSRVQWWRGERLLADSSGEAPTLVEERVRLSADNGLEVVGIIEDDAGEYECRVERPAPWGPIVQKHSIQVLYSPTVSLTPPGPLLDVKIGDEVSLACDALAFPTPTVTWSHLGNFPEDSDSLTGERGSRLKFTATSRRLAGLYTCTAQNGVGVPVSATIRLRILHPPEVSVEREWVHASPGMRAEVACTVTAEPPAKVTWSRGKQSVPMTTRITRKAYGERYSLVFHRVLSDDLTSYTCTATNALGKDQGTLLLTGVAREATFKAELQALSSQDKSFTLIWEAESYTPIINYKLEFRRTSGAGGASNWTEVVIPADGQSALVHSKSFVLTGLTPGTSYEAAVRSRNAYGWSPPSEVLTFSTNGTGATVAEASDESSEESNAEEDGTSEEVELASDRLSAGTSSTSASSLILLIVLLTAISSA